jgi:hypothetical protein
MELSVPNQVQGPPSKPACLPQYRKLQVNPLLLTQVEVSGVELLPGQAVPLVRNGGQPGRQLVCSQKILPGAQFFMKRYNFVL